MEEMTARQYAIATGRPPRTVQQWVEGRTIPGVRYEQLPGAPRKVYLATREVWDELAAQERKVGRPKKEKPQEP